MSNRVSLSDYNIKYYRILDLTELWLDEVLPKYAVYEPFSLSMASSMIHFRSVLILGIKQLSSTCDVVSDRYKTAAPYYRCAGHISDLDHRINEFTISRNFIGGMQSVWKPLRLRIEKLATKGVIRK